MTGVMEGMKSSVVVTATCLLLVSQCAGLCHDLDAKACQTMSSQDQQFCKDSPLATSVCPKFCKKCPLVCYHCDNSVSNYTECTSFRKCQTGEQCLLQQLLSSKDGHQEYKMSCASLDICDGNGIMQLGRRHINPRNLITQCCSEDLCNSPGYQQTTAALKQTTTSTPAVVMTKTSTAPAATTTSTTNCYKDIEFLIEDSTDGSSHVYIRNYLSDIVNSLSIGVHQTMVGMALYDHDVNKKFDLDHHTNKSHLLHSLKHFHFEMKTNRIDEDDVMEFLLDTLRVGHHGDRRNYPDVVVIMVDHFSRDLAARFLNDPDPTIHLSDISKDVIVINVGAAGRHSVFSNLASDSSHVIDIDSYPSLSTSLKRVLDLICA